MAKSYNLYDNPGEIVSARRAELSLSQAELAARAGLRSSNFITMIERGRSHVPLERSVDIAKALEMRDPAWFAKKVLKDRYPAVFKALFEGEEG